MGNYTKFEFHATLKWGLPKEEWGIYDYLQHRLDEPDDTSVILDRIPYNDHPFFNTNRWDWILTWHTCQANNYESNNYIWDCDDGGIKISIDTILKNYNNEIEWFLMWIAPYIDTTEPCLMTKHYEEYHTPEVDNKDCGILLDHICEFVKTNPNEIDPEISRFCIHPIPDGLW